MTVWILDGREWRNKFPALFIEFNVGQTHFFSKKWVETRSADVSMSSGQAFTVHCAALWVWIVVLHCIEWKALMLLRAFTLESHGHFKSLSPSFLFLSYCMKLNLFNRHKPRYNPKGKEVIDEEFCEIHLLKNGCKNVMMLKDEVLGW